MLFFNSTVLFTTLRHRQMASNDIPFDISTETEDACNLNAIIWLEGLKGKMNTFDGNLDERLQIQFGDLFRWAGELFIYIGVLAGKYYFQRIGDREALPYTSIKRRTFVRLVKRHQFPPSSPSVGLQPEEFSDCILRSNYQSVDHATWTQPCHRFMLARHSEWCRDKLQDPEHIVGCPATIVVPKEIGEKEIKMIIEYMYFPEKKVQLPLDVMYLMGIYAPLEQGTVTVTEENALSLFTLATERRWPNLMNQFKNFIRDYQFRSSVTTGGDPEGSVSVSAEEAISSTESKEEQLKKKQKKS